MQAKPPIRLLVLSYMFPRPDAPCSGIFVAEQISALRELGIDARALWGNGARMTLTSTWLPPPRVRPTWYNCTSTGVPAASFHYQVPPLLSRFLSGEAYARAALKVARQLSLDFPFDLVHAHTSLLDGYAASFIKKALNVPFVLTEHSGPFSTQTDNPCKMHATKFALRTANELIAVSSFMRDEMAASFPFLTKRKVHVVGNGFNPETFPLQPRKSPDGKIVAIWIANFIEIKQPLLMLQAFASARRSNPHLRLQIAGTGPMEAEMRNLVSALGIGEEVSWLGSLNRSGVADAIGASDFLVVSSRTETFSLVTLEAIASGRPVLTTRCGGPEEIVNSPKLGYIVDTSEAGLESGFLWMSKHCLDFDPLVLRSSAISRFSHESIALRLGRIYETLLEREVA